MSDHTTVAYPLNDPSWTQKGVDALVDGDIIRIVDTPHVRDATQKNSRGVSMPVLGPDRRPVLGNRATVARVLGLSPTLCHPKAATVSSMASGFYRSVYVEVLHSEGTDAYSPGQTTNFLQHNANRGDRQTSRWPLTGPNWPAPTSLKQREVLIRDFGRTARHQRDAIDGWAPMRAELERLAPRSGRTPKAILEELAPAEIVVDVDATRLWVAKIWNGQSRLTVEQRTALARLIRRIANESDEAKAAVTA